MAKRVDNSSVSKANYPTQLCIAREAGLSRTTVAEILAGKRLERYNDDTQRKVFETAKRLNYRPHRSAQEVRRGRSNLIGVFHSTSMVQTAGERAQGLGRAIMRSGFELLLNDGLWYDSNIEHSIEQMLRARVEGIIISGPLQLEPAKVGNLFTALESANIPVVSISTYFPAEHVRCPAIGADFIQGFSELTKHLIGQGRRRLLLESSLTLPGGRVRYKGLQRAMREAGGRLHRETNLCDFTNPWDGDDLQGILVDMEPMLAQQLHDPCGCGTAYMEQLLERHVEADAVMASNDFRAFGMLSACYRQGIPVPETFAFTGGDNSYLSRQGPVPITSLQQPIEEMCDLTVETLVRHIKGTATSRDRGALLPCRVVVRESSTSLSTSPALSSITV